MRVLIILLIFTFSSPILATDYYISSVSGNDNNSGTSEIQAWKTIAKLNANFTNILPGDKILFKRGETFRGEIIVGKSGEVGKNIIFDAYGNGELPVISGRDFLTGWVDQGNDIYKVTSNLAPNWIWVNGKSQQIARQPNSGFTTFAGTSTVSQFTSTSLSSYTSADLIGAFLFARTQRWFTENREITAFSSNSLSFASNFKHALTVGNGFFLTNSKAFIDQNGEFSYLPSTKEVFLKWPNASSQIIEAAIIRSGIRLNTRSFIEINNIAFNGFYEAGIVTNNGTNVSINNCQFSEIMKRGIYSNLTNYIAITNSTFVNMGNRGIEAFDVKNSNFTGNKFKKIGLNNSISQLDDFGQMAILTEGKSVENLKINLNEIDSVGYNCIRFGINTLIENNVLSNFNLVCDDGGGINAWGVGYGKGSVIKSNIIFNGIGNITGLANSSYNSKPYVHGIYLDDNSTEVTVQNNTIYNMPSYGIDCHNSFLHTISNNIIYNCGLASIGYMDDNVAVQAVERISTSNNQFVAVNKNQWPIEMKSSTTAEAFSTFSGNTYYNCNNKILNKKFIDYNTSGSKPVFFLEQHWTALDPSAKFATTYNPNYDAATLGVSVPLTNSSFNNNVSGWYCWTSDNTCASSWDNTKMGSGSFFGNYSGATTSNGIIYPNTGFTLQAEKNYLLKFRAVNNEVNPISSTFNLIDRNDPANTYKNLTNGSFAIYNGVQTYSIPFKISSALAHKNPLRLDFYISKPTYFDDIEIYEAEPITSVQQSPCTKLVVNPTNQPMVVKPSDISGYHAQIDGTPITGDYTIPAFSSLVVSQAALVQQPLSFKQNEPKTQIKNEIIETKTWPNPISEILHFQLVKPIKQIKNVKIFNVLGREVSFKIIDQNRQNQTISLDLKNLISGNYFMFIEFNDGQVLNKKLIKK